MFCKSVHIILLTAFVYTVTTICSSKCVAVVGTHFSTVNTISTTRLCKARLNTCFLYPPMLCEAARRGHWKLVHALINCGADINVRSYDGQTLLHYVALNGRKEIARFLLDRGSDVNAKASNGSTPLHKASSRGHVDVIRLLLDRGARLNQMDNKWRMPLHQAAANGYSDTVQFLLDQGAYMRHRSMMGTALDLAINASYMEVAQLLVFRGAGLNRDGFESVISGSLRDSNRPMYKTLANICRVAAELLWHIDSYVLLGSRTNKRRIKELLRTSVGQSVLHFRSFYKNNHGKSPWVRAIDLKFHDAVEMMLKAGADANTIHSYSKVTPLHRAVLVCSTSIVRLLLNWGANVNLRSDCLGTPLEGVLDRLKIVSCPRVNLEMIAEELIWAGADFPDKALFSPSELPNVLDDEDRGECSNWTDRLLYAKLLVLRVYQIFQQWGLPQDVCIRILNY